MSAITAAQPPSPDTFTPIQVQTVNPQSTSKAYTVAKIGDIIRGSLLTNRLEQIPVLLKSVIEQVTKKGGRLYVINFWSDPKPLSKGYVGVHLKIRMPIPPAKINLEENIVKPQKYILMELQLHLKQIMDGTDDCAKEIAHRLYKLPEEVAEETASSDVISSSQLMYLTSMVKLLYGAEELKRVTNTLDLIQAMTKSNKKMRLIFETALLLHNEKLCQGEWNEKLQAVVPIDKDAIATTWIATAMKINEKLNLPVVRVDENDSWTNTATTVDELYADAMQIAPYFEEICKEAVKGDPDCSVNFGPGNEHMIKDKTSLQAKMNPQMKIPRSEGEEKQKIELLESDQKAFQETSNHFPTLETTFKRQLSFYYPRLQKQIQSSISLKQHLLSFTGRQAELTNITSLLDQTGTTVLYGPAGIGKTELAITFANEHLDKYALIWFISCSTEEERTSAYMELASVLKVAFHPGQRTEELYRSVHLKLENMEGKPWLLIYDNFSTQEQSQYPQRGGHILITSLAKHPDIDSIEVPLFSLLEAQQLMTRLTHKPVSREMNELIEFCGYYPAILERVGMDIRRIPGATIQSYLKTLSTDESLARLPLQGRYQKTLEHAILQTTAHLTPQTLQWLQACCYLHPSSIPLTYLHRWLTFQASNTVDSRTQTDILIALSEHAIQQLQGECLSMPTIFHKALALLPTKKETIIQVHELLTQEAADWSAQMKTNWELAMTQASVWSEHAIYLSNKMEFAQLLPEKQAILFHFLGTLKEQQSQLDSALTYHQKALTLRQQLGAYESTAISLDNIGICYYRLNQREQAAAHHQKAEALRKEAGAEKPLDVAQSLLHRAMNYYSQGKPQEALDLCTQALKIQIKELGEQSIEVAATWFSLGQCEELLGSNHKALVCYKKAHTAAQHSSGDNHPVTRKTALHLKRLSK